MIQVSWNLNTHIRGTSEPKYRFLTPRHQCFPYLFMSVQRFLKLDEPLELLNNLDLDETDIEISLLQDASELIDEVERDENEVNTG
ncbi:hypothetical protein TNCV_2201091 [Trichonephila clavipes]|nr:hypothetical protein TNCV_2201091 [Trichonephila clavipes]